MVSRRRDMVRVGDRGGTGAVGERPGFHWRWDVFEHQYWYGYEWTWSESGDVGLRLRVILSISSNPNPLDLPLPITGQATIGTK